ncbi:ribosomal L1 domain-containing protein CG13096 [Plodia interpunctella]|uniref:ribosomal L1 domain-containing protein CG13096 n=1 Tax=Plodia interpunctella TaxID=58824 RepID=UPI00236808D5|nr:ribosomal L1 domain-containing protein CG13096 [Plodia interpunctella]
MVSMKQPIPEKARSEKTRKKSKLNKIKKSQLKQEKASLKPIKKKQIITKKSINELNNVANKVKLFMPSKYITEKLVEQCLQALEKLTAATKNKNAIFDEETPIFAEIKCIKIQNTRGNIKIVLPYSTAASTGEVCLIVPDLKKGKKPDHEPTIDHWEEILRKANVTAVKTILPMRQLRVEYDQFELKRRLMTQHDFLMVDTRILNHVSHVLGKMFFKKHNMLIPVRINEKADIKKDIDTGLRSVMLRLNEGHTSTIVVGHTGMPQKQLKENVMSLIESLQKKFPGGEANIRSISLKLPLSLSIPLYVTLRSSNTINVPRIMNKKPKYFTEVEDELSTIPGSRVRVAPDGTVHVLKSKDREGFEDSGSGVESENDEVMAGAEPESVQ